MYAPYQVDIVYDIKGINNEIDYENWNLKIIQPCATPGQIFFDVLLKPFRFQVSIGEIPTGTKLL